MTEVNKALMKKNCENKSLNKFLFVKITFWLLSNACMVKKYLHNFVLFLFIYFMLSFFFLRKELFDCYLMLKRLKCDFFLLLLLISFMFSFSSNAFRIIFQILVSQVAFSTHIFLEMWYTVNLWLILIGAYNFILVNFTNSVPSFLVIDTMIPS